MFGSLIVILPTEFRGGELVLRHNGKEHKYDADRATGSDDDSDSALVSWITFFSDVEHEVLPVTEGYRVTLTYVRTIWFLFVFFLLLSGGCLIRIYIDPLHRPRFLRLS